MGYYSTVHGSIEIEPPLTWQEIQAFDADGDSLFKFDIEEAHQDTPEGVLTRRYAPRIFCAYSDEVKAYSAVSELEKLVNHCAGRALSGEFRIEGEESGDVRRLFVGDGGEVVEWKARLTWPDGSSEPGRA